MGQRDDGGPAFPLCRTEADGRNDCLHTGMSLRSYYKSQAIIAAGVLADVEHNGQPDPKVIAERAAAIADALVAEDLEWGEDEPDGGE